jgi:hypothetical protein
MYSTGTKKETPFLSPAFFLGIVGCIQAFSFLLLFLLLPICFIPVIGWMVYACAAIFCNPAVYMIIRLVFTVTFLCFNIVRITNPEACV